VSDDDRCRAAIAAIDRALEDRPDKVYGDLADVVRALVQLRDHLIATQSEGANIGRLDRCNAVLSLVIGAEYPLEGVRRDRIQQARDQLASLLDDRR
jgi:hypothetical protein